MVQTFDMPFISQYPLSLHANTCLLRFRLLPFALLSAFGKELGRKEKTTGRFLIIISVRGQSLPSMAR